MLALLSLVLLQPADPFAKWEKEITAIEKRLRESPPAPGQVCFAGSSTIRLWDLKKSFPGKPYVNVGFGGCEIRDVTHFAPRIILPHKPGAIVFYAGDNDMAKKRTAEQVRDDFREFCKTIHKDLPKTQIFYLPIKPSLARWTLFEDQKKANGFVRDECAKDRRLTYLDIVPSVLGPDGKPRPDHFVKDGLHLSEAGYKPWAAIVEAALAKHAAGDSNRRD
jgi:lysophospholipase L1-like esterase